MDIRFFGATREVTGSCALIECNGRKVLVDCGMFQGSRSHERHNRDEFAFDPDDIDAVVLTHAHIDHSGRIPLLIKRGYRGPVFAQQATVDLCKVMWADAGYLNEKEAEWDNRDRRKRGLPLVEPIYTVEDAARAQRHFDALEYEDSCEILPGIAVTLLDAGHILGSSIVSLVLNEGGRERTIVFSGDLGHRGAPILRDPAVVTSADRVVLESTYGDRQHRSWEATWEEMGEVLSSVNAAKGNILIPAFTIGRTQELLYVFRKHFEEWGLGTWQIYLDSPMAIEATEIYARHFNLYDEEALVFRGGQSPFEMPNLHMCLTPDDSKQLKHVTSGAIIIAGSGMCTGGRIKHHLKNNVWRRDAHVVMVGFQAGGTPGRALVDGARKLRIFGDEMDVHARVHTIGGLSAHAGQDGLLSWYESFEGHPPVTLVHGEESAMARLQQLLRQRFDADVTMPEFGERLDL